jgi:uncharacterized membrane protein YfcA
MDWWVAARYAAIGALIVGAVFFAVGAFYRVWYSAGVLDAVALLALSLCLVYTWSRKRANRERERLKRSSPQ